MKYVFPVLCIILIQPAYAYVGPGLGAGTIGMVLGLIGSFFLALFAVIYYPIKRALKKWKAKQNENNKASEESKK